VEEYLGIYFIFTVKFLTFSDSGGIFGIYFIYIAKFLTFSDGGGIW
jgi:hypothetical protein